MNGPDDAIPEQTSDDLDLGWGDEARDVADTRSDEWYLSERPPHHGT